MYSCILLYVFYLILYAKLICKHWQLFFVGNTRNETKHTICSTYIVHTYKVKTAMCIFKEFTCSAGFKRFIKASQNPSTVNKIRIEYVFVSRKP